MCGIAGIIELKRQAGSEIDPRVARTMVDKLFHRGPDHGDVHIDGPVALGHRRLSVIDLVSGNQPMFNENGMVGVVFNGEIYNFQTVAAELKALGHTFKTNSDTEIIVHGWEQWGVECLQRFRGMFAFVLWDKRQQKVFIARDRLGVKPLYYALLPNGQLIFGSELKALEAHPKFQRVVDDIAVENYLSFGYVPEPDTIYAGAKKLAAAHFMVLNIGNPTLEAKRYWSLSYEKIQIDAIEAEEEMARLIEESVRLRLIADVPLGAFLSGGVDSSVVVATMAKINPSVPVTTCSIGFDVPNYDESEFAKSVATHCNTNHITRVVTSNDLELVDQLTELFDEPFSDSSALPSYRVSQIARERVTVSLSGDGGDEAFGGYRRYRLHLGEERARAALPSWVRKGIIGPAAAAYPQWGWLPRPLRAKTTLQSISSSATAGYYRAMSAIPESVREGLRSDDFAKRLGGYHSMSVFENAAKDFAGSSDAFDFIQHIDLRTWLPGDINVKADRTSMAHSLEVREPLLDHKLIEFAASLPQIQKVSPTGAKIILKSYARKLVPQDVIDRPKQGFSVPMQDWFKGPLAPRLEAMADGALSKFLSPNALRRMLSEHRTGARNHDRALWTAFCLGRFLAVKV